jgi:hypothetical protein
MAPASHGAMRGCTEFNQCHPSPTGMALGLVDFALLVFWMWPPWTVVVLSALGGAVLARL